MRRSMLFMPGSRPGNINNGVVFGSDAVIIDMEDAVPYTEKDTARFLTRRALMELDFSDVEIIVRINGLNTPFWQEDLNAIIPAKPDSIMPPKVGSDEDVKKISDCMSELEKANGLPLGGIKLIPLIESAWGVENALKIATSDERVDALYLGAEDLSLDIDSRRSPDGADIFYSRARLVIAAKAAGIQVLDTPFLDTKDDEGLRKDALYARNLGFNGKAAIYPLQVDIINEVFSPTEEEYEYSLEVLEAMEKAGQEGKGAITLHGKLVDFPMITRAKRVVDIYDKINNKSGIDR
jgi:citrate lyase subunit beta/citryl-CoA lyase